MESGVPFHVLLAEDNSNDVEMFRVCLERARILNDFHVVPDGEVALQYVRGEGEFADRSKFPRPGLIFLDLNLPNRDGISILRAMRKAASGEITVGILGQYLEELDAARAASAGASSPRAGRSRGRRATWRSKANSLAEVILTRSKPDSKAHRLTTAVIWSDGLFMPKSLLA